VVLATGGFQSNLQLVREHWPHDLPVPEHLLAGSGINSTGSGIELAQGAGGTTFNLDHQWNYERGLPDPRYPGQNRGLNATVEGVRVNALGRLLLFPENAGSAETLRTVLDQPGATYWIVFDDRAKNTFWISGSNWGRFDTIQRVVLNDPSIVKQAATIDELAAKTGLPVAALKSSISKYNEGSAKIRIAPFYAAQFFPLTRKSMGGIAIDLSARVLDTANAPIPGLYAAGEAAGEAGMNGKAALEGTFLGPAVVIGRKAARSAVADLTLSRPSSYSVPSAPQPEAPAMNVPLRTRACTGCHNLEQLVDRKREGYWHFEHVHKIVLERKTQCEACHAGMGIPPDRPHLINRVSQIESCKSCHIAQ
jgi:succinate dehydrogenase/fumarate reductase flavoprotein subunit